MGNNDSKCGVHPLPLFLFLAALLFAVAAQAQTLSLMAPSIANDNGAFVARFGVTVVEKPILKGELEDGAELILKCEVELAEINEYWLDTTVSSASFQSVIKYDRITKEYVLTLPGKNTPLREKDFETLLRKGWGKIEARLGPWNMLEKGTQYSLRLITTMNEVDAPEGLGKLIYFWSWDAGADNTFHLNFTF